MTEWKRSDQELPPIGEEIIVKKANDRGYHTFKNELLIMGYTFQTATQEWPTIQSESSIKEAKIWWLKIPPIPEDV